MGYLVRLGGAGTGFPLVLVALRICTGAVFVFERLVITLLLTLLPTGRLIL